MKIEGYKILTMGKYRHILCKQQSRENSIHPNANYRGTGMALCGVLTQRESSKDFIEKHAAKDEERQRNYQMWRTRRDAGLRRERENRSKMAQVTNTK